MSDGYSPQWFGDLTAILGAPGVQEPTPAATTDWLGRTGSIGGVVRPESSAQVADVVGYCRNRNLAMVPMGGNTGLVGGTVGPLGPDSVVVDLTGLRDLTVDPIAGVARAGAGVTLTDLQRAAADAGWYYGVDLAARDSATVGGTVATNAGGIRVCAFGSTRAQLLGIQAVLPDGSLIDDLRALPKDNTGYSLRDLLCGSEGTLGIVTAAALRLHRPPGQTVTFALTVDDFEQAVATAQRLSRGLRLLAAETVDADSWRVAAADLGLRDPVGPAAGQVLLVELDAGARSPQDALDEALAAGGAELDDATVVAVDEPERRALWRLREGQAEWWAAQATGAWPLHKYDVTVPVAGLDATLSVLAGILRPVVRRWGVFGHVYEGSLHVQAVGGTGVDVDRAVLTAISEAGGSLSAEHGVGRDKAAALGLRRSAAEIEAMTAVKRALDPDNLMNPGVLFPL